MRRGDGGDQARADNLDVLGIIKARGAMDPGRFGPRKFGIPTWGYFFTTLVPSLIRIQYTYIRDYL